MEATGARPLPLKTPVSWPLQGELTFGSVPHWLPAISPAILHAAPARAPWELRRAVWHGSSDLMASASAMLFHASTYLKRYAMLAYTGVTAHSNRFVAAERVSRRLPCLPSSASRSPGTSCLGVRPALAGSLGRGFCLGRELTLWSRQRQY
jgi:hypothetical protein